MAGSITAVRPEGPDEKSVVVLQDGRDRDSPSVSEVTSRRSRSGTWKSYLWDTFDKSPEERRSISIMQSCDNEERALITGAMNQMAHVFQAWLPLVSWQQVEAPAYPKGYPSMVGLSVALIAVTFLRSSMLGHMVPHYSLAVPRRVPSSLDRRHPNFQHLAVRLPARHRRPLKNCSASAPTRTRPAYFRNAGVHDTANGSSLYSNNLTDPAVLLEYRTAEVGASVCLDGPKRDRLVWLGDFYHTARILATRCSSCSARSCPTASSTSRPRPTAFLLPALFEANATAEAGALLRDLWGPMLPGAGAKAGTAVGASWEYVNSATLAPGLGLYTSLCHL
ncbi:hypothetical protein diail_457 [Diaporthe ilicicola]|nr:hypothetical protein diail_457 [Diaporthe ilicicola]